jgi:hypothetical protein
MKKKQIIMIKLYKIDELDNGTERFCTQLQVGMGIASFIREKGGDMKFYNNGEKSFGFYKYDKPFEIVKNLTEMKMQPL